MAWYDDVSKLSHVATYKNEKDATKEAEKASKKGWVPSGTGATDGHINLGRTVAGAALTGGLSLLFGGSRSKGKVTITYTRDQEWLAKRIIPKGEKIYVPPQPTVTIPAITSVPQEDLVSKLKQLKDTVDAGLISQEEYDKTKAAILAKM